MSRQARLDTLMKSAEPFVAPLPDVAGSDRVGAKGVMTRSLSRRLDDALCAFATGHSRRDIERVRRKRLALRAMRTARAMRAYVAATSGPDYLQDWLDELNAKTLASASAFDDVAHRLLVGLECESEAALLNELYIHSAARYARARRDLLDIDAAKGGLDVVAGEREALGVAPRESKGKLHKGLTKQACLDFLYRQFGLGCGDGHPGSPDLARSRHAPP